MSPKDQIETRRAIAAHGNRFRVAQLTPVSRARDDDIITSGDWFLDDGRRRRELFPLARHIRDLSEKIPEEALKVPDAKPPTFAAVREQGPDRDPYFAEGSLGTAQAVLQLGFEIAGNSGQRIVIGALYCPFERVDVPREARGERRRPPRRRRWPPLPQDLRDLADAVVAVRQGDEVDKFESPLRSR
jgi:hypothetical protein